MSFCPNCGTAFNQGQAFCTSCGYEIRMREIPAAPEVGTASTVYGMDTATLYVMDGDGITFIGTRSWTTQAIMGGLGAAAVALARVVGSVSSLVPAIVAFLVLAPVMNAVGYRKLRRLLDVPLAELRANRSAGLIPWGAVASMSVKRGTVSFLADKWRKASVEVSDDPALSALVVPLIGGRFEVPPQGRRILGSGLRRFAVLTLAFVVLTQGVLLFAAVSPFLPGEKDSFTTIASSIQNGVVPLPPVLQAAAIFTNNVQIALLSLVPGFGIVTLSFSAYNTGRVVQAISLQHGVSPTGLLLVLFLLPHSWIEELSYPMAGALSLYYLTEMRRPTFKDFSNGWRRNRLSLGAGIIALALAVAAVLEVSEPPLGLGALLFWVPVAVAVAILFLRIDRFRVLA